MKTIGIIGGTGVYSPDLFIESEMICIVTPYGEVELVKATYNNNTMLYRCIFI